MAPAVDPDLVALIAPISQDDPCGPDLEADDDDDYTNIISSIEVVLPTEYMVANHLGERLPFYNHPDFSELNIQRHIGAARRFCNLTHDLRLLALLAKLHILNRSVTAFQTVVEAMTTLLETHWDDVHPRVTPGNDAWRVDAVERLDEPLIVAALNSAVLFTSRRYGVLTWQAYATAVRKASGDREGADTSSVDRVLSDECNASPDLVSPIRTTIERLNDALARMRDAFSAHDAGAAPRLVRIGGAAAKLQALFERIQPTTRGPGIAGSTNGGEARSTRDTGEADASRSAPGTIVTARRAATALDAATRYLSDAEPSSPALLLLRQAQALVGKPFLDAMRALFPEQVRYAGVAVATPAIFRLPLTQLAENGHPARDDREGGAEEDDAEPVSAPQSRSDALMLLDGVAAYYRMAEPSSPIPMLLDRARPLLGQDFMGLVRSMLPARVLSDD